MPPIIQRLLGRAPAFPVAKSGAEWRAALGQAAYDVLRRHHTEPPHSSPLNAETRAGTYHCAGCDAPLYPSSAKFDSRTGWPSFTAPVAPEAIGTRADFSLLMWRAEYHCARCGGHLGHVFNDGPRPTGQRHCINGLSLRFVPGGGAAT